MIFVQEGIFLGNVKDLEPKELLENNINHVLSLCTSFTWGNAQMQLQHVVFKVFEILDTEEQIILDLFEPCFQYISAVNPNKNNALLLHCQNGVSRSPAITVGYLMRRHNWTCKQALTFMKTIKPDISPNPCFLWQLQVYEDFCCVIKEENPVLRRLRCINQLQDEKRMSAMASLRSAYSIVELRSTGKQFRITCRFCRATLCLAGDILHGIKKGEPVCSLLQIVDQLSWMRGNHPPLMESKIICPGCKRKVGHIRSQGVKCCDKYYCPGIYFTSSKVDLKGSFLSSWDEAYLLKT